MNFQWLANISPFVGVVIVCAFYLGLLVWVLTRSRRFVSEGAADSRRWRDLRIWIVPLILIQVALHLLLR